MSYSCSISFKTIKEGEVYSFFQVFKKEVNAKFCEIANDNKTWLPSIRYDYRYRDLPEDVRDEIDRAWAHNSMFKYRWFYLPEHQLLGVFGIEECVKPLFDLTVYFQNSCDQDYEFEEWKGIPIFESIAEKWATASTEAVAKKYKESGWGEDFEESEADYYRRTFAYDEIWAMCSEYLDNESKVVHLSLFSFYENYLITTFCRLCREAYAKDLEEFRKKYEAREKAKENSDGGQ